MATDYNETLKNALVTARRVCHNSLMDAVAHSNKEEYVRLEGELNKIDAALAALDSQQGQADANELRECPFCGGEAKMEYRALAYEVGCSTRKCPGNGGAHYSTEQEAVMTWNKRVPSQEKWTPVKHEFSLGTLATWDDGIEDGDGISDWWIRINEIAAPLGDCRLCELTLAHGEESPPQDAVGQAVTKRYVPVDYQVDEYTDNLVTELMNQIYGAYKYSYGYRNTLTLCRQVDGPMLVGQADGEPQGQALRQRPQVGE